MDNVSCVRINCVISYREELRELVIHLSTYIEATTSLVKITTKRNAIAVATGNDMASITTTHRNTCTLSPRTNSTISFSYLTQSPSTLWVTTKIERYRGSQAFKAIRSILS